MNKWQKRIWVFAAVLLAAGVSCVVLDKLGLLWNGPQFSHRIHVVDQELSCTECHLAAETGEKAGMPKLAQCGLCHDAQMDAGKPRERTPAAFFDENGEVLSRRTAISEDVQFSHKVHAGKGVACTECHGAMEETGAVPADQVWVNMQKCVGCHTERQVGSNCKTCHTDIDENWKPKTHEKDWKHFHGKIAESGSPESQNQCSACHQESTCRTCHQEEEPASHNNFWRERGHGLAASVDRESCAVCHRQDTCEECHSTTAPKSHIGAWGGATAQHCATCHFPLNDRDQQCLVCHKGAPSHNFAAPKPTSPVHDPLFDCRSCHMAGNLPPNATLPHVDGGSDCNACHR